MKLNEEIKLTKYRISQFKKVKTIFCEYKTKVKFIKPNGETNWLDISNDEFKNFIFGEVYYLSSKNDLISSYTGWYPKIALEEGLERTIKVWKNI